MGLWGYGVMGLWGYGVMGLWGYGVMGLWNYGVMGLWGYGVSYRKTMKRTDRIVIRASSKSCLEIQGWDEGVISEFPPGKKGDWR